MATTTMPTTYTADERGAYALGGAFKVLAAVVAGLALLGGFFLAATVTYTDFAGRAMVFGAVAGCGLLIALFLAFFGYVLALLVSISARLRG